MNYRIAENRKISNDIFSMTVIAPDIAGTSLPGQFLNIKVPFDDSKILRRPFSICDAGDDQVTIKYQIKGEGTLLISKLTIADDIDIIGPLGKGFPIFKGKKAALVGGGIGIFPLLYLKNKLSEDRDPDCYLGFKNSGCVMLTDEFRCGGSDLCISTDDGTSYNRGYITSYFKDHAGDYDVVYACGPSEMLKAVKGICENRNVLLYLSLEERMGCGIGACLVCACKVKTADVRGFGFKHVCKDGPVFDSREVIL